MVPLSVLDLSPIVEGGNAGQSLRNSLDLARRVEALGYRRFWMAEHHNLPGIASAATAVALAHVAAGTNNIKIGAGGIMLPNHAHWSSPSNSARSPRCIRGGSSWVWAVLRGRIRLPTKPSAETCTAMSTIFREMLSS